MDLKRPFWEERINTLLKKRSILWLNGVRRSGKTTLAKKFAGARTINCDLPSVQREADDPEIFLTQFRKNEHLALDEVHRLNDPALLLKIAADERPDLKILATGSSTLAATQKFSDSLTGRKAQLHLLPILPEECESFGMQDLTQRLLRGGLPPAVLSPDLDPEFYSEWLDSYFARDVQELFSVEKRQPFLKTLDWVLRCNGQMIEVTGLARAAGISRPTAIRYLEILEVTNTASVVRPFHDGSANEIVKTPKIYGFDTGFVCHTRGWNEIRSTDAGHLLENLTLESLQACVARDRIHFWRTKTQHEVDFIVRGNRNQVHAIECKWSQSAFDRRSIQEFRRNYPTGRNWLVCADAKKISVQKQKDGAEVTVVPILQFRHEFATQAIDGIE